MSSLVWVCTSTHEANRVSVIDANNPADVLDTFRVSVSHILCIASIPGNCLLKSLTLEYNALLGGGGGLGLFVLSSRYLQNVLLRKEECVMILQQPVYIPAFQSDIFSLRAVIHTTILPSGILS